MIKVCSAVYGECMPEFQHKVVFDNWYSCAQAGLTETKDLMQEIAAIEAQSISGSSIATGAYKTQSGRVTGLTEN